MIDCGGKTDRAHGDAIAAWLDSPAKRTETFASYLGAFFTDGGVLPREGRLLLFDLDDRFGFRHQWSLHMLSGEAWPQLVLMLLAGLLFLFTFFRFSVEVSTLKDHNILVSQKVGLLEWEIRRQNEEIARLREQVDERSRCRFQQSAAADDA